MPHVPSSQKEAAAITDLTSPMFHNEDAARAHFEVLRWPSGAFCPRCASTEVTRMEGKTT